VFLTGVGVATWWYQSGFSLLALDVLDHLVLPMGTVILLSFGETMLLMRTSMLEVVTNDYVLTARAKGLADRVVRDQHVARNAILPVLTRLLLNLPFVLIGCLSIELVFNWDAIGQIIFTAIEYHDIPVLMGILSMVGVIALAAHIVLDILYVYLDPRLRYAEGK
jgi:peptide/nickel transport system permease protein